MSQFEKELDDVIGSRRQAIELLKSVLYDSVVENEYDEDIYNFLVEEGEDNPDFEPYWV